MILIVGAGLAGLSTAYHLKDQEYLVCEKEGEVGGLCRSCVQSGFVFDYTGHLLHLKSDYSKKLIEKLLPGAFLTHARRASVYSHGVLTPYPFQAHLHGLPPEVRRECMIGFIESYEQRNRPRDARSKTNAEGMPFGEWITYNFGKGIARHFMIPYNKKMWKSDLDELSCEWVEWSIPVPRLAEVMGGALGSVNTQMGYSAQFLYPARGGIEVLPRSFAPHLRNLHCNKKLIALNMKQRRAWFEDKSEVTYDVLISTIPLPELLNAIKDAPSSLARMGKKLRYISVLDINLGIGKEDVSDQHWIYFPGPEFFFYRVGVYSNFAATMAPPHQSALYVEVSYLPHTSLDKKNVVERVYRGLKAGGLLNRNDHIVVEQVVDIPYAYVVHDAVRYENLPKIMSYLKRNHIFSIGRYGSWGYLSMEDAIMQGKEVAEVLYG